MHSTILESFCATVREDLRFAHVVVFGGVGGNIDWDGSLGCFGGFREALLGTTFLSVSMSLDEAPVEARRHFEDVVGALVLVLFSSSSKELQMRSAGGGNEPCHSSMWRGVFHWKPQ